MTVQRTGRRWRGTEASDVDAYLVDYAAGGYPIARVEHARCQACGGAVFAVELDDDAGFAERVCAQCAARHLMLDSAEQTDDGLDAGAAQCPCGGETFNVAVGFALRRDGDVRWVSVGLRCVRDGTLGVYADWKIDYSPTAHLLNQA